jgi:phosphoribosylglycinamide formyltransferase-1
VKNIAIFASGTGTNAAQIMKRFEGHPGIRVRLLVSNKANAPVLQIAEKFQVPSIVISRNDIYESDHLLRQLESAGIDFIVLAGFLWLIPPPLVKAFADRLINIHPALLPKYGGKGMYGMRVHEAVKAAGETQTGITIHYVNEQYDEGSIIFQKTCAVEPEDSPDDIAQKVHRLEHAHYPDVIEKLVLDLK